MRGKRRKGKREEKKRDRGRERSVTGKKKGKKIYAKERERDDTERNGETRRATENVEQT